LVAAVIQPKFNALGVEHDIVGEDIAQAGI
jgi:hypothetical protein